MILRRANAFCASGRKSPPAITVAITSRNGYSLRPLMVKRFRFHFFTARMSSSTARRPVCCTVTAPTASRSYEQLLPEFERTSGIKVTTGSGASQGAGPQTIAAQLARGVPANVVILSREGLSELIAAKRIAPGTDVDLARVPLGVAGRAGTPKPDVSTVEAFKQVLLKAKTVAIPGRNGPARS